MTGPECISEQQDIYQIQVVPQRILNPDTSEKLLSGIYGCENIRRVMIQGSRLPTKVSYGPGTGEKVDHPLKRSIEIEGQEVDMRVTLSRVSVEVIGHDTVEKIRKICSDVLPFPFEFYEGVYFKKHSTITDYAKLGPDADELLLGMTDPKAGKSNTVQYIKSEKSEQI